MESNKKQLINPQELGGYPYYGSDFVNLQERLKDLGSSYFDYLVNLSGTYKQYDAQGQVSQEVKAGVFLTYPTLTLPGNDPANAGQTEVSSFVYYVDGELLYYPGGILDLAFSTSNGTGNVIAFTRDEGIKEARTFKDGASRDATVQYNPVLVDTITYGGGAGSYILPAGLDFSKQYVFVGFSGGSNIGTRINPNKRDLPLCLGIPTIEEDIRRLKLGQEKGDWVAITDYLPGNVQGQVFYRVEGTAANLNRIVRFRGQIEINQTAASEPLFNLSFSVDPPVEAVYPNGYNRTSASSADAGTGLCRIRFSTGNTVYSERTFSSGGSEDVVLLFDGITYALD